MWRRWMEGLRGFRCVVEVIPGEVLQEAGGRALNAMGSAKRSLRFREREGGWVYDQGRSFGESGEEGQVED